MKNFRNSYGSRMCIGFERSYDNLLGAIFLRNFDIVYDTENQALSFVRARCDNSTLFGSFEKNNRVLVNIDTSKDSQKKSKFSRVRESVKHFFGTEKINRLQNPPKIERFSNRHFKENIKYFFFTEQTMIIHVFIIFGIFLVGIVLFFVFFFSECFGQKDKSKNNGKNYNELVDQD